MSQKKTKYWRIVGYNGTKRIYQDEVLLGCLSEKEMKRLLRALVARAGLGYSEIVDSYSRKTARRYAPLLEVTRSKGKKYQMMCGTNPHFVATVIEK